MDNSWGGGGEEVSAPPSPRSLQSKFPTSCHFVLIFLNSQLKTRNGEHGMGKRTFKSGVCTINGFLRVGGEINK